METGTSNKNMKSSNYVTLLYWVIGVIAAALVIAATAGSQLPHIQHLLIVAIVLLVFMWVVSLVNCIINKSCKDNYEVNKDAEKGQENTAFDGENSKKNGGENQQSQQQNGSSTQQTGTGDEKWMSNYVPFGDYPKGNIVYVKEDGPN